MKIENFERASQIVRDIKDRECFIRNLEALMDGGTPRVEIYNFGKVVIPDRFSNITQGYAHNVLERARTEVRELTEELETL